MSNLSRPVSTIRYRSLKGAMCAAARSGITNTTYARDAAGWYMLTGNLPGPLGLTVNDYVPMSAPAAETPKPAPSTAPTRDRENGPVAICRRFAAEHPGMAVKEAVARLVEEFGLHPATASIQYKKHARV